MNWYSFIFSEKRSYRLWRHLIFWALWWVYFLVTYFYYQQTGLQKVEFERWTGAFFSKSFFLLSIHILSCYCFINFLLPRFLLTGKYFKLIGASILLGAGILFANFYMHRDLCPLINKVFDNHPAVVARNLWWTSVSSGLFSAPKVIAVATGIKLIKRWYLKQKEKERLEKEKLITNLALLKAQIHPEFLFSSLDKMLLCLQKKDVAGASTLLLRLADILSYMLYDCNNIFVPLDKEIKIIKDYVVLQKTTMEKQLEIDIAAKGEIENKRIVPLLLFPFIESSFARFANQDLETYWLNIEFFVDKSTFTMKVISGKSLELSDSTSNDDLDKTIKRLNFFYAGNYELKTTMEPEIMMTYLKINLTPPVAESENTIYATEQLTYAF